MPIQVTASRYHDLCCGHRVHGHESKCAHLHGHNYRVHFKVTSSDPGKATDTIGRVLDFSVINSHLCEWLEANWDHKFLIWANDPLAKDLYCLDPKGTVIVPFNPTAENMATFLLREIAPRQLKGTGCKVIEVVIEETRKCSAAVKDMSAP